MPRINHRLLLPLPHPLLAQTHLAGILALIFILSPTATAQQYTNWTQLPACAQYCFSTALLQAFGSCGSILTGTDGNATATAATDDGGDPPSTMLRRCICTDCSYRDTLGACLDSGCAATATTDLSNDPGLVDGSLALNDRVFCNASVGASVQMWNRNLIWVVDPSGGDGSGAAPSPDAGASSEATQGGMIWTCSSTSTSSAGSENTGTGTAIIRPTIQLSVPSTSTTTMTAIMTVATLTLATTPPYQVTVLPNSASLTVPSPSDTGSDVLISTSTSTSTSISTDLSNSSRSVAVVPTTPAASLSTTTTKMTTTHLSTTALSSSGSIGVSTTGTSRAEQPIHPVIGLGILLVVLVGAPLIL